MPRYTTALNNYLQGRQETHLLSWAESSTGPNNALQWTSTCKIGGVARGTATAATKSEARNLAAQQALEALGVQV
ncbi:hypothetical protein HGRIS_008467 [Hohenbuehelia grisea]|uniref:DRBM domain-containing protein n=1 Tax=Hohenbuehelia grisea TaxID=104357 RepID=A0ABR3J816_9AGAR